MRLWLLLGLLAACEAEPPSGFGVNLTIRSGRVPAADRQRIERVRVLVEGDEPYSKIIDGSALRQGTLRAHYIPSITIGMLDFRVDAVDSLGLMVASGSAPEVALAEGRAVSVEIELTVPSLADLGTTIDLAGADLSGDLSVPDDLSVIEPDDAAPEPDFAGVDLQGVDLARDVFGQSLTSPTTATLYDVWGNTPDNVYLVGDHKIYYQSAPGQWDPANSFLLVARFNGVWGANNTNQWIVGDGATILRGSGNNQWTVEASGSFNNVSLNDVFGLTASNIYVVGDAGTILHSGGDGAWSQQATGLTSFNLNGVWGSGGTDVYAVGDSGTILHRGSDGTWTSQTSPVASNLFAVFGTSAMDVWIVGEGGNVLRKNTTGWTKENTATTGKLRSVWASGPSDIWAAGYNGAIQHSTGDGTWVRVETGTGANLFAIWGFSASDMYAVGSGGTLLQRP